MGRNFLKVKNFIKSFPLGRIVRNMYQARRFTKTDAEKAFNLHKNMFKAEDKEKIIADMLCEAKKHSISFEEYILYQFHTMPEEERRTYVSTRERINYCERMNGFSKMIIFDDKALTYKYYKKYYHRDLVGISSGGGTHAQEIEFKDFFSKHPKFIVKPFDGAGGVGIKIVDYSDSQYDTALSELKKEYPNGFVVEELIIQAEEMAVLHPASVNTVRITTVLFDDRVEIVHPFLRTGRGDSVVDNGGSGGIICALDPENGTVIATADEEGNRFETHPETGIKLIGFTVPEWDKAVNFAKELAKVMPDQHYMGWDLAYTKNGWIMQEANDRGGFVGFQLPICKGFRAEIEAIVKELNV